MEGKYVIIHNDKRFEGVLGQVLSVSYVTLDGVKTPLKARVKVVGCNVYKSGFTDEYIERKDLVHEGLILLKDACNLEVI